MIFVEIGGQGWVERDKIFATFALFFATSAVKSFLPQRTQRTAQRSQRVSLE